MLRFISICCLALLVCSCFPKQRTDPNAVDEVAQYKVELRLWDIKFAQLPGSHISGLIQIWGEPEKLENNEYRWHKSKEVMYSFGGYVSDGYTEHKIYDSKGYYAGSVQTSRERYVAPDVEVEWCEILVTTDKNGIITRVSYDGSGSAYTPVIFSPYLFPFP